MKLLPVQMDGDESDQFLVHEISNFGNGSRKRAAAEHTAMHVAASMGGPYARPSDGAWLRDDSSRRSKSPVWSSVCLVKGIL